MQRKNYGFTLMEMLIVIAVVAVLVGVAIPVLSGQLERAREGTDAANMRIARGLATVGFMEGDIASGEVWNFDAETGVLVEAAQVPKAYGKGTEQDGGFDESDDYNPYRTQDLTDAYIYVRFNDEAGSDLEVKWRAMGINTKTLVNDVSGNWFANRCASNRTSEAMEELVNMGYDPATFSFKLSTLAFSKFQDSGFEALYTSQTNAYSLTFTTDGSAVGREGQTVEIVRYWYGPHNNGAYNQTALVEQRGTATVTKATDDGFFDLKDVAITSSTYIGPDELADKVVKIG